MDQDARSGALDDVEPAGKAFQRQEDGLECFQDGGVPTSQAAGEDGRGCIRGDPEYRAGVIDEKQLGDEHVIEAGMIVEGELGKKNEGIGKLLKSLEPATWDGKGMPTPELSEAEKAKRKRKAEEKK